MGFFKEITSLDELPQFEVEKAPLFFANGEEVPKTFSLQRTDTGAHLGTVSSRYQPIQMSEMTDIIQTATSRINEPVRHVGWTSSKNDSKIVIQSECVNEYDVDGDVIRPTFYTIIDNTGKGSNKVVPSTIRIVCDNSLHLIKDSRADRARHSSSFGDRVNTIITNITQSIEAARNFKDVVMALKSEAFNIDQMVKLTELLIPVEKEESSRRVNKRQSLIDLYEKGRGNDGRTKWDALNSITEFETHNGKQSSTKFIRNLQLPTMSRKALQVLTAA